MRSARAFSAGPNTRARSLVRFTFLLLARALLAISSCCRGFVRKGVVNAQIQVKVKVLVKLGVGEKFEAEILVAMA